MPFVDSHCHIDGPEYDADRDDVIARARDAGVTTMLNVGTGDPQGRARAAAAGRETTKSFCRIGCIRTSKTLEIRQRTVY